MGGDHNAFAGWTGAAFEDRCGVSSGIFIQVPGRIHRQAPPVLRQQGADGYRALLLAAGALQNNLSLVSPYCIPVGAKAAGLKVIFEG